MNNNERADVLVIGSGAAGAAVTKRLAELGAQVVCLEQGDWRRPGDYPSSGSDFEAQMQRPQFSFNPNIRRRPEDYPRHSGRSKSSRDRNGERSRRDNSPLDLRIPAPSPIGLPRQDARWSGAGLANPV